jgi:hypothetical protein
MIIILTVLLLSIVLILLIIICFINKSNFTKVSNNEVRYFDKIPFIYFNIFIKNNKLYLICPIYEKLIDIKKLDININNKNLFIHDNIHTITKYKEPCQILIFNINDSDNYNTMNKINIKYINESQIIYRNPIYTITKNKIAITTLFKDDYYLFDIFYNYYLNQGISHFYMYYNDKITNNIKNYFDKPNVTLIEWNYIHRNFGSNRHTKFNSGYKSKYAHHAQPPQMHDALYQYGKDNYEYMIFCDLDEYIYFPNFKIIDFVYNNHNIHWFKINCHYANTIDNKIPKYFPNKIKIDSTPAYHGFKNIYKTNLIKTLGVHLPVEFTIDSKKINMNNEGLLLHFQSWNSNKTKRKYDIELIINN